MLQVEYIHADIIQIQTYSGSFWIEATQRPLSLHTNLTRDEREGKIKFIK